MQGAEPDIPLVAAFARNGTKRLESAERTAAREYLAAHPELRKPVRGGKVNRTGTPGAKLTTSDVQAYPANVPLYASDALRTFFLEFDHPDWEQELAAFWHTDVEVAAKLTVDGKSYADVGVGFRGNNSFTAVPEGLKRPLSISVDFVNDQDLLGHRSLNLLNGGRGGSGVQSDPLSVLDDPNKALRQKLLAVPKFRERYLAYVGDIADKWLDWDRLGPLVEKYRTLIAADVERDTRKLDTTEAFTTGIYGAPDVTPPPASTIRGFANQRRAAILAHPEVIQARAARAGSTR